MSTPTVRAALERLVELDKWPVLVAGIEGITGIPMDDWFDAIAAVRAALAAEPEGEGPSDAMQRLLTAPMDARGYVDLRCPATPAAEPGGGEVEAAPTDDAWWYELVSEIARVQHVALGEGQGPRFDLAEAVRRWCRPAAPPAPLSDLANRLISGSRPMDPEMAEALTPTARWNLYEPAAPPAPEQGEVATIAARLKELASAVTKERWSEFSMCIPAQPLRDADLVMDRAATLLAQQAAPAPAVVAVPVAERPWEWDGWCDAEGRCWALSPDHNSWHLVEPRFLEPRFLSFWVLLLPHDAIPLPQVGEAES